jgi:DUF1365 family protein
MTSPEYVPARTVHVRNAGGLRRRFSYGVDYVLIDPEAPGTPALPRNRRALVALHDADHGGPVGHGRGVAWLRDVLRREGLGAADGVVLLLAQPRILGRAFNPVSFWLCHDGAGVLRVVVAEVTNTYGDRHSYLCHADDLAPIGRWTVLTARKRLHVSPFLPIEADYRFRFDIGPERVAIRIEHAGSDGRLVATLAGPRRPLTRRALLGAALRRPVGAWRVRVLIHWHALWLWLSGARFRRRPAPPTTETSR